MSVFFWKTESLNFLFLYSWFSKIWPQSAFPHLIHTTQTSSSKTAPYHLPGVFCILCICIFPHSLCNIDISILWEITHPSVSIISTSHSSTKPLIILTIKSIFSSSEFLQHFVIIYSQVLLLLFEGKILKSSSHILCLYVKFLAQLPKRRRFIHLLIHTWLLATCYISLQRIQQRTKQMWSLPQRTYLPLEIQINE